MALEMERRALLEGIRTEFGVELLWHEKLVLDSYRDDTSVHSFFAMPGSEPTEETKRAIRQWVERHNWQFGVLSIVVDEDSIRRRPLS
jgi:hypothetical protein